MVFRLGDNVRAERSRRQWSRERLAKEAGVSYSRIRRLEDGAQVVDSLGLACRIADAFGMPVQSLIPDHTDHPAADGQRLDIDEAQSAASPAEPTAA